MSHSITLNNGGMHRLAMVLGMPGVLTKPGEVFTAGVILETHLLDLPETGKLPEEVQHDQIKATAHMRKWERDGAHSFELTERQREVAKVAVRSGVERGVLAGGAGTLCLMRALGLNPEEA